MKDLLISGLSNNEYLFLKEKQCLAFPLISSNYLINHFKNLWDLGVNIFISDSGQNSRDIPTFCDYYLKTNGDSELILRSNKEYVKDNFFKINKGVIVLQSSGSEGKPKYVVHSKPNVISNASSFAERFSIGSRSKLLLAVPIHHMFGFGAGLIPSFITNCNLKVISNRNVLSIFDNLKNYEPDFVLITSTVLRMMNRIARPIKNQSIFICAGNVISQKEMLEFKNNYGRVINLYGSTEMGVLATSLSNSKSNDLDLIKPLPKVKFKIGESSGELLCHNKNAFISYIPNNQDSVQLIQNEKWYKTNDIVSRKRDLWKIHGRKGSLVKRKDIFLSLDQLEIIIRDNNPQLTNVVVIKGSKQTELGIEIIAFLQLDMEYQSEKKSILNNIKSNLQSHNTPDKFVFTESLPKLNNGKIDRKKLSSMH